MMHTAQADGRPAGGTDIGHAAGSMNGISARYLVAVVVGLLGALAAFCLFLYGLHRTGNLPPPAFSNSLCVDEKLNFLRQSRLADPNLLVIGSSVAWRHFDGQTIVNADAGSRPLNGAFCGLHANQSVYVANWLLDREPTVKRVVMIVDPLDFSGCWRVRGAVFDRADVDAYVYGQALPWMYYMRYFSPVSLVRNALSVKGKRNGLNEWDPLEFNRYGDGPLRPEGSRNMYYTRPEALDQSCFASLHKLAMRLKSESRDLTVVTTPLHPDWKTQQDPDGQFLADFDQRLNASLAGTPALYWNADREWQPPVDGFVDAIHMRWSAAKAFSAKLGEVLYRNVSHAAPPSSSATSGEPPSMARAMNDKAALQHASNVGE